MTVSLKNLRKTFADGTDAVKSIDLDIEQGEFITLLGPSGCGKTTTLRLIAGLEEPTSGEIYINGRQVNDVDPGDRDIAMVFQSYAIWPHMTVAQNVAYPLEIRKIERVEIDERVDKVLALVGLTEMSDKLATQLSGGQQQRASLARAIVSNPLLLLFDEPLSNLDEESIDILGQTFKDHRSKEGSIIFSSNQNSGIGVTEEIRL